MHARNFAVAVLGSALAVALPGAARAQPQIDVAPPDPAASAEPPPPAAPPPPPPPAPPAAAPPAVGLAPPASPENTQPIQERVTDPSPESQFPLTTIGGYGQMDVKFRRVGFDGDLKGTANVRRIVLLVGHQWTERISSYVELEWENAVACSACQGIAEVEQAFVDAALLGPALRLRVGLILVPMGLINRAHEPPVFFSVDRPSFDQSIIPTTWREMGIGFVGRFRERLRWEAYMMTALDPTRLGPDGIVGGRSSGSLGPANAPAFVGRVEVEPMLGSVIGLSGYGSDMAPNADLFDANGQRQTPFLGVFGWAADARFRKAGLELRAVAAQFFIPRAGKLLDARRIDGSAYFPDPGTVGAIPNRTQGGYLEAAYDVLRLLAPASGQQLFPFVRAETYDTQAAVPFPYRQQGRFTVNELTMGLSYLPIPHLVGKADVQLRDRKFGLDELQVDFGLGWMF